MPYPPAGYPGGSRPANAALTFPRLTTISTTIAHAAPIYAVQEKTTGITAAAVLSSTSAMPKLAPAARNDGVTCVNPTVHETKARRITRAAQKNHEQPSPR